jgi:RNA polymerase sigma-70 factor (ECF subfamily)
MDQREEKRIVLEVLGGEANAYALLVRHYERPIFNLMVRMTGSQEDALDLAQETFLRAYEKLDGFKTSTRFFPWLYAIGLNLARDFLRKKKLDTVWIENVSEASPGMCVGPNQEREVLDRLDAVRVAEAMGRLPVEYREAIILRYKEELPMKDIAKALDVSVSGAKMRVSRGLGKLRDLVAEAEAGRA